MLVKRVHPDMTIDANPSTSSMKTPEEPDPELPEWQGNRAAMSQFIREGKQP
jgi:hypothetical protein